MRKNQIKHLFLKFIVFVGLAFLTFTCEQDKIVNETQEESILKNQKAPTIRTFSQDNIGDRFNDIVQQLNIRKYLKKSIDLSYSSRTSYDTLGVTIYTDEIKEVTIDDYTSYTMRMATPETDSTSFYNVTIEDDNGVTEMYVSKYTPTQAWLENKDQVYEGNISTMRVNDFTTVSPDDGGGTNEDYGGLGNNYSEPQGSPYYPTDCIGVVIITYENIPYPCGCGDMPWDNCQGCPPSIGYPQYPGYNQIPYYYCEEYADQIDDSAQNDNTNTDTTTGGTTTTGNGNNSNPDNNLVTVTLTPLECSPAPRGDLDGDCQLDAYETYMNVKQCLEQNDYTLNQAQSDYLQTNFTQATTINNYLQNNNCSEEAQEEMILAIDELSNIDENNYPGMDDGYPYEWWNDDEFVENNISFELDDQDYDRLTEEEKKLVKLFPISALEIKNNKIPAENETLIRFNNNGVNDKSDAFRHAFFNAMNAYDTSIGVALLFSNAHESEVPEVLYLEEDMDISNNWVGLTIGDEASIFDDEQDLSDEVYEALMNGELLYLYPLDIIQSPRYDADDDGIQDCPTCLNGIITSTELIATNLP